MDKKIAIVVGVLVLLLVVVGLIFFLKKPSMTNTSPNSNQAAQTNDNQQTSGMTSLKDLMTKGISETCTYSNDKGNGTVYVNSGKVRGDFNVEVSGQTQKSHMIIDGNTSYIWLDGQSSGYKMTFDPNQVQATDASVTSTPQEGVSANEVMNYNCKPWVVDKTLFNLPSDVDFIEFMAPTGMMQPGDASPEASGNSTQCAYCESLTGDSKTQCLTALHCN